MPLLIDQNTTFEEGLNLLGLTIEDLVSKLDLLKSQEPLPLVSFPGDTLPLKKAISNYLNELNLSSNTFITYSNELTRFEDYMIPVLETRSGTTVVSNITTADIKIFLKKGTAIKEKISLSPSTYNKKLSILRSFFISYLLSQGFIRKSPTYGIKFLLEGKSPIRFLTRLEQENVLKRALFSKRTGPRNFTIIFLALNTGLRLQELTDLNVNDIDFNHDCVIVRHGKGDKYREVFITDDVREHLSNFIRHHTTRLPNSLSSSAPLFRKSSNLNERLSRNALEKLIIRIFRDCGIDEGACHRLRHTFALNALDSGLNLVEIKTLLGHEHINTTIKYLRLDTQKILKDIKANFPLAFLSIKNIVEVLDKDNSKKLRKALEGLSKDEC